MFLLHPCRQLSGCELLCRAADVLPDPCRQVRQSFNIDIPQVVSSDGGPQTYSTPVNKPFGTRETIPLILLHPRLRALVLVGPQTYLTPVDKSRCARETVPLICHPPGCELWRRSADILRPCSQVSWYSWGSPVKHRHPQVASSGGGPQTYWTPVDYSRDSWDSL